MIIAALALNRLYDDGADVDLALRDAVTNFLFSFFLARNHIRLTLGFWQRKIDVRTRDARPIKLREQIRFARIGVGEAHRVAASPMKRILKMQDFCAAFAMTRGHVLA